jgi:threonine dehydrogenase-like Zn-dependent dehydrogenase
MRQAVIYGPRDIRVEDRADPKIEQPTDAVIRLSATCVCGSDLWPYRGIEKVTGPAPMGHEYVGVVEEVGADVRTVRPGQFVIGSFFASDNTCANCRAGYQSSCVHRVGIGGLGAQADLLRAGPGFPSAQRRNGDVCRSVAGTAEAAQWGDGGAVLGLADRGGGPQGQACG